MRAHYVLNHGGTPSGKLADVEIHFEDGLLAGIKLVGCSVWKSKKGEAPTVLVPSRTYATAAGVRYYELLRASADGEKEDRTAMKTFKQYIRDEYLKVAPPQPSDGKKAR